MTRILQILVLLAVIALALVVPATVLASTTGTQDQQTVSIRITDPITPLALTAIDPGGGVQIIADFLSTVTADTTLTITLATIPYNGQDLGLAPRHPLIKPIGAQSVSLNDRFAGISNLNVVGVLPSGRVVASSSATIAQRTTAARINAV